MTTNLSTYAQNDVDSTNIHIISSPQNGYVIRGERFETDIYVLANEKVLSDQPISIRVEDKYFIAENGHARYTKYASQIGLNTYSVEVTIPNGDENITVTKEFSFEVGERCIMVSASRMNVFYRGIDNPFSVAAAGISSKDIQVSVVGATITKSGMYDYTLRVEKPGMVTINVQAGSLKSSFQFRVKSIPDPTPIFGGLSLPEEMDVDAFKGQRGVALLLNNFDFDAKCEMLSYEIVRIAKAGNRESAMNEGARFGETARGLIDHAEPGDMYIFRSIKGECPGDQTARNLLGFSVQIK